VTKGEIVASAQAWLGLQSIDDLNEVPLIERAIYRGTIDLLARTRCVARCVHLHYFAGEDTYTLDHGIISLIDVEDGLGRRLRRDQDGIPWDYVGTIVYPSGYVSPNSSLGFTLIRSDVLQLKPTPSEDGDLDVWAVLRPAQMVADTDDLGDEQFGAIPEEFQDAVELYTLWKMADYADNASSRKGEQYRVTYEGPDGRGGRIQQIKSLVNKRGTARAPARRVTLSQEVSRDNLVG
jgi:hypothetical protein